MQCRRDPQNRQVSYLTAWLKLATEFNNNLKLPALLHNDVPLAPTPIPAVTG